MLTTNRIRKYVITSITLIGIIINSVYGIELLSAFFTRQFANEIGEILISAISLEIGWAVILIWVVMRPFERRHLLLFTAIPIISGNVLYCIHQWIHMNGSVAAITINFLIGMLCAGLFVLAFFFARIKR